MEHDPSGFSGWRRYFFRRSAHLRATWTLRLGLPAAALLGLSMTTGWWAPAIARGLVCEADASPSDAILVENLDTDYFVFERAAELRRRGLAARVLIPIWTDPAGGQPNDVALGTADLMARISRLGPFEVVPIKELEPISLNVARTLRRYLLRQQIRSIVVVAPYFRSRRSALVYGAVLGPAGVRVRCQPAKAPYDSLTWPRTWHGTEDVALQWGKLRYYQLYVLPFDLGSRVPRS